MMMRRKWLAIVAMTWCALPGCDGEPSGFIDAGPLPQDGAIPEVDAGPRPDGSTPEEDAGIPPFDAGPPESCATPGTVETVACGRCGSVERFCAASGSWAYGECVGQGGCMPGSLDDIACGNCGMQEARCNATCEWEMTGACEDEGICAPGTRSRSSDGCGAGETREVSCNATCMFVAAGSCESDECTTPGAIETVACGNCGEQDRFCTAGGVWEYGTCMDEGVCAPGSTEPAACGDCGTRTRRCLSSCTWDESAACTSEGECSPGAVRRTDAGCPSGETRELTCNVSCMYAETAACDVPDSVDVMLLLDMTGSHGATRVEPNVATLRSRLIDPLLALGDVAVGISYYADFPVSPYGSAGDRPFDGGIEPTTSGASLGTELAAVPTYSGGDGPESGIEALFILSGGTPVASASPLVCTSGRAAGGCWRSGARRVVIVYTDAANHNGPDSGSILEPYEASVGAATWSATDARLSADGTQLIALVHGGGEASTQHGAMLVDLGQSTSNLIAADTLGTALDAAVARVRAVTGL